jgi:hypothetical protein
LIIKVIDIHWKWLGKEFLKVCKHSKPSAHNVSCNNLSPTGCERSRLQKWGHDMGSGIGQSCPGQVCHQLSVTITHT